jgi:hypothetical protein
VRVTQGNRERVGRVAGRRGGGEAKDVSDHLGNLGLLGLTEACDLSLHSRGWKCMHGKPGGGARLENDPADVGKDEGTSRVDGVKEIFHGQTVGLESHDESLQSGVDEMKAFGELSLAGRSEDAVLDQPVAPTVGLNRTVSGTNRARVDTEDDQRLR